MFFFGILFIIVIVKTVLAEMELCLFEELPALAEEEQHQQVHEEDRYISGWEDLGADVEKTPPLSGFDFLGGSPTAGRKIVYSGKNPAEVFWSRSQLSTPENRLS